MCQARFFEKFGCLFVNDDGSTSVIVILASIALGYGVPYTFLSGFEVVDENAVAEQETETVLEGGIEADILDEEAVEAEETEEAVEEETEESTEE